MRVTIDQTCDFAEHWKCEGVFVAMSPAAIKFATDWSNICLISFIEMMVERQKKKAATATAPAAEPAPQAKSSIVLTGADS